jgi:hypothetical protein
MKRRDRLWDRRWLKGILKVHNVRVWTRIHLTKNWSQWRSFTNSDKPSMSIETRNSFNSLVNINFWRRPCRTKRGLSGDVCQRSGSTVWCPAFRPHFNFTSFPPFVSSYRGPSPLPVGSNGQPVLPKSYRTLAKLRDIERSSCSV